MPKSLQAELRQSRPFRSLEEEAALNLYHTNDLLQFQSEQFFGVYNISPTQYNVLRILRGAGETGLGRNEIRERMVGQMPDVSRLLDRLERQGLIRRQRSTIDRRYVPTVLTEIGLQLVNALDQPVEQMQHAKFGHLSEQELRLLIELLTKVRHRNDAPPQ